MRDTDVEAITEYNVGHAHTQVFVVRYRDAAKAAYQRSRDLRAPNDDLGRACRM